MSNISGALICFKRVMACPQTQNRSLKNQIIQSVYPIFPNDKIFNKIVKMFVDQDCTHGYGQYCSRAITGEPICAYIQTDKEGWLVAITRSVIVKWPTYEYSEKALAKRVMGLISGIYTKRYVGTVFGCRVHSVDLDELSRETSENGPQILRKTEGADILAFPMSGRIVCFKKGFRIKIGKDGKGEIGVLGTITEQMQYTPKEKQRAEDVFTPNTLNSLWDVYSAIEKDPKLYDKYIKGEIVGEPADNEHPIVSFHATLYESDFSACYGGWGHIPGVALVDSNGNIYNRRTPIEIPAPPNGERLLYKSEISLLTSQTPALQHSRAD